MGILTKLASLKMLKLFKQLNAISGVSMLSSQRNALVLHMVSKQLA